MKKQRYFDYAATTPVDKQVVSAMLPYFKEDFGNPGSLYRLGQKSKFAITKSTKTIAKILNCRPDEFVFTGSATEADNLAILGVAKANKEKGGKIITTQIEHKAVLKTCDALEKDNFKIVRLPVLKNGLVDLEVLKKELDAKTILISITMADSETGTIQPIAEISKIIKEFKESEKAKFKKRDLSAAFCNFAFSDSFPHLHTDASQSAKFLDLDVEKLGADLMTISSHKIYGPKGVGGLYVKKGTQISPIIYGGGQQRLRSGTENVAGIVGFVKALELVTKKRKTETARIKKLRDTLEKGIFKIIPKVILNGHPAKRLPNFLNISILDVEGEALLLYLDELGIMVSTGSACNSQSLEPSYILSALGNPYEYIHGSLRFTLGKYSTSEDVKYVLKHLPEVVKRLRQISPFELYEKK
ncbi:MAG: cysteine desulfurase family protein [Patescibacteria group bacterium]